jgi:hypothetical protein
MPGLSGYDVLARLKEDEALREIPVLMITALDDAASVSRSIALGAADYLAKPSDPAGLRARVRACLTKKRGRDFELAYLRGVGKVTAAAVAVESGASPPRASTIARRPDALGNLARLFQRMAAKWRLGSAGSKTKSNNSIAIDERKKAAQVDEITDSDYFRNLKARPSLLRPARRGPAIRTDSRLCGPTARWPDHLRSSLPGGTGKSNLTANLGVPCVPWEASGGSRHRHPVARDPHAVRARGHQRASNAQ